jgi:hypothetical protein
MCSVLLWVPLHRISNGGLSLLWLWAVRQLSYQQDPSQMNWLRYPMADEELAVSVKLQERANLLYDEDFHGLCTNYIGPLSPTVPPSSSRTSLFPLYRSLADLVG